MNHTAGIWRCGAWELSLDAPIVMGILNATPDSFSDGGSYVDVDAAVARGLAMVDEGATIVDVGGESTRPGALDVAVDEEIARVTPVIERLVAEGVIVSVDTRNAPVARAAVGAGAVIVNDVTGFTHPEMVAVAAETDAGLVVMHSLGDPRTMGSLAAYDDVVTEVTGWLLDRTAALAAASVSADRVALDPGLGFAKTTDHNLELLAATPRFAALGHPLLIGISRKRSIGEITGVDQAARRDPGSVAAALLAVERGAHIVRVHDVASTAQALAVLDALKEKELRS